MRKDRRQTYLGSPCRKVDGDTVQHDQSQYRRQCVYYERAWSDMSDQSMQSRVNYYIMTYIRDTGFTETQIMH